MMLNQIFDATFLTFIAKLSLAMLIGLILGLERIYAHKTAGMRTYALVVVATCFFSILSQSIASQFMQFANAFNPVFIAGDIIIGIGFLGAGLIIFKDGHIENLTTAAGIWVCAGIGIAIGYGFYREAIFVSILTFFVMGVLSFFERKVRLTFFPDPTFEQTLEVPKKPRVRKISKKVSE